MKASARYLKIVEWSEEDQCFIGSAPGIIGQCCHGDHETEVYAELCVIVDEWIEIYKQDGKPLPEATAGKSYSGKIMLRTNPELHQRLAIAARQHHQSLNKFCIETLQNAA
ncbi:MAG: toxin-antitoxin system HicB family antitoxin [Mariprofundaceae bacterium]|nr:toxin-antitoxin system HicB family antitoxin [Mariprofundaceae bacterium]